MSIFLHESCKTVLAGYVFSHHKQKDHPNFVEVKGHKYLSFFYFPKIRAGKSVKQVNKIELPNLQLHALV